MAASVGVPAGRAVEAGLGHPDDDLGALFDGLGSRAAVEVGRGEAGIDHPAAGTLTLDCDVLSVAGSDLRIMIYTAEPGSADADRLALVTVLGTQSLAG